jgi:hypothetical protein
MKLVELHWSTPVRVRLQDGLERTFSSVNDAVDFLENEWPMRNGSHYEQALTLCRSAEQRRASPEIARDAFIGACIAASIAIRPTLAGQRHKKHSYEQGQVLRM